MSLLRVDWNPNDKKVRQFALGLVVFAAVIGLSLRRQSPASAAYVFKSGAALGVLTALWPSLGRFVYKAWMGVAFIIGTVLSFLMMAVFYFAVLTPLALFMRLRGRDVLRLRKPDCETYWTTLIPPKNNAYFERLF